MNKTNTTKESKKIELNGGRFTTVDAEDYEKLSKIKWTASCEKNKITVCGRVSGKSVRLTRYLLNPPKGLLVDHINHDTLDNRRENLRICTPSENSMNRKIGSANKSGYKGVNWYMGKWWAHIGIKGRLKYLGNYQSKVDAAKAYNEAAKKYFGEFAYLNKIPDQISQSINKIKKQE